MKLLRLIIGHLLAAVVVLWGLTCRRRVLDDPRPALRAQGRPYVYALLHAHQVAAVLLNDEPELLAMVSRSVDGDLLVPLLRWHAVHPVRGSNHSGGRDKGGASALLRMVHAIVQRGTPALLAVDGPRGPRNRVQMGVVRLAQRTNAVVLPVVATCSRAWVVPKTWDAMEIPLPFSQLSLAFGAPLDCQEGEATALQSCLHIALNDLEQRWSPQRPTRDQQPSVRRRQTNCAGPVLQPGHVDSAAAKRRHTTSPG